MNSFMCSNVSSIVSPYTGRGDPTNICRLMQIGECLDRLKQEGNLHLIGSGELPTILQSRFRQDVHAEALDARLWQSEASVKTLEAERNAAEHELRRLEAELFLLNRSRALKFGRRIRRLLMLPVTEG